MAKRSSKVAGTKAAAAQRLTYAMRDLLIAYKGALEESLRPYGLTLPQLRLLHAVAEREDVSSATIARECHVTPQTLQAMMKRAMREGWILRERSESNQRILTASLTPRGRRLLDRGERFARRIEEQIWKDVPSKTLSAVAGLLELRSASVANLEHPLKMR
jgi:DNA-binding MarR family transcriptional regulator